MRDPTVALGKLVCPAIRSEQGQLQQVAWNHVHLILSISKDRHPPRTSSDKLCQSITIIATEKASLSF